MTWEELNKQAKGEKVVAKSTGTGWDALNAQAEAVKATPAPVIDYAKSSTKLPVAKPLADIIVPQPQVSAPVVPITKVESNPFLSFIDKTLKAAQTGLAKSVERLQGGPVMNKNPLLGPVSAPLNDIISKSTQSLTTAAPETLLDTTKRIQSFSDIMQSGLVTDRYTNASVPATDADKLGKGIDVLIGGANTAFIPVVSIFEAAKQIPGVDIPVKGMEWVFGKTAEVGSAAGNAALDALPIPEEDKESLRQPISDLTGLISMIVLGGALFKGAGKAKDIAVDYAKDAQALSKPGTQAYYETVAKHLGSIPTEGLMEEALGKVKTKVQERTAQGVKITPEEAKKIVNEVNSEVLIKKAPEATKEPAKEPTKEVVEEAPKTELEQLQDYAVGQAKKFAGDQTTADKRVKGVGMEFSGIKRSIEGKPTDIEYKNAERYLKSNYQGKEVLVDGVKGVVSKSSFGKVGVKFEDGTTKFVAPEKVIGPEVTRETVINHIKEQGQQKLEGLRKVYTGFKPQEIKPTPEKPPVEAPKPTPAPKAEEVTKAPEKAKEKAPEAPVEAPEAVHEKAERAKKVGRVYERMQQEHPSLLEDIPEYERVNMKKDAEAAIDLIEKDPQEAYQISMGMKEAPAGQTSTTINIALADRALTEGNTEAFVRLTKARNLDQVRRGQEINAEKGSVSDNSASKYVSDLIKARLQDADKFTFNLLDRKKTTATERVMRKVDVEVNKARKTLSGKELDIKEAQSIIDSLICK